MPASEGLGGLGRQKREKNIIRHKGTKTRRGHIFCIFFRRIPRNLLRGASFVVFLRVKRKEFESTITLITGISRMGDLIYKDLYSE